MKRFGPKSSDDSSIGKFCAACHRPFIVGDYTTLIALGPGDDEEMQIKAAKGLPYTAVATEIHWDCSEGPAMEIRGIHRE